LDQREDGDRKMEPADSLTADQEFQRQWARTVLQLVMKQLEEDYRKQDKLAQFQQLKPFIARQEGQNYQAVADQLEMTASAARMATSRLRDRFRFLLRQEIAQTVASEQDVDEEIHGLFLAFQV
jgi:RNA polymerase sigma-70 factor (ECF subfamily)